MTRPAMLIVRPEPSRGLGAFYRNLGLTMLATHARACGLEPDLVDLTFEDFDEALARGAGVAAFSLYIDDFARGIELAEMARAAGLVTVVGGPHATLLGHDVLAATDAFDLIGVGDCLPEVMPVVAAIARGGSRPAARVIGEGQPRPAWIPWSPTTRSGRLAGTSRFSPLSSPEAVGSTARSAPTQFCAVA